MHCRNVALLVVGTVSFIGGTTGTTTCAADPPDRAKLALLKTFVDEFVPITPGEGRFPKSFRMGDESEPTTRPAHVVTLKQPFAIAKYEVPQNLYAAVVGANPSVWGGPRNSVEMVSWQDAQRFCQRATALLREAKLIGADEEIRLPTEAEWEYCCRAGTTTAYGFGDDESQLDKHAWHTGNAAGNDPPVGALRPNAWDLYDMHGYLWEYVADSWHTDYQSAPTDGSARNADAKHQLHVIRGGSWRDPGTLLKSSTRWPIPDHVKSDAIGFRCVKSRVKS